MENDMNNINNTRTGFFPNAKTKTGTGKADALQKAKINNNSYEKQKFLDNYTKRDAKVDIPEQIKDFAQIKKAADMAPEKDNSDKIAMLKKQIAEGSYKPNYDAVADKLLGEEFGIH